MGFDGVARLHFWELKLNFLRGVDKYAGPAVCFGVLFFKKLYAILWLPAAPLPRELKKVLVIKFFGIGSILLASPAIGAIKKKHPAVEVTLLTLLENRQICEILPSLDRVVYLAIDNPLKFLLDYAGILRWGRREDFDAVVDLEFLTNFSALTTLLITLFKERTATIGFNSPLKWRNSVYSLNVSFDHSRHIAKIFVKVFSCLGGDHADPSFEEEKKSLLASADVGFMASVPRLSNSGEPARNVCVNINSGALSLLRRWPREYFAAVVKQLLKTPNVNIIFIGGKSDVDYVRDFGAQLPASERIIDLCGKLSIRQLIGMFGKSDLLVTNDSGPLHIAMIAGLPTISFFGPETPCLYGPIGEGHHVFYADLYCSPCLNIYNSKITHCRDNVCLKNIGPDTVLKLIEEKYHITG